MTTSKPTEIRFFIDPACPWCWLTSRWVTTIEEAGLVKATFSLFSLKDKNAPSPRVDDEPWPNDAPLQLLAAAREETGEEGLRRMYTALGEAHHELGNSLEVQEVLLECAASAGFTPAFVEHAIRSLKTRRQFLSEFEEASFHGVFGVPSLMIEGHRAFFGPVLDTRLDLEDASAIWHSVEPLLTSKHFFELKQERTGMPDIGRLTKKHTVSAH